MGGRRTNLALLILLAAVFLSGWLAFSFYAWPSRAALLIHSAGGLAIVALLPWKSMLARRSVLRRGAGAAVASALLGLLLLVSLVFGFLHTAGWPDLWTTPLLSAVPVLRELTAMELHVGAAIALVPLLAWHLLVRPVKARATDLTRRLLLRTGLVLGASAATLAILPAASRRLTGSYELAALPTTSWMLDPVPAIEASRWSLRVGSRSFGYDELVAFDDRAQALLDCTGGWYSEQVWEGAWLSRLLPPAELNGALSVSVVSTTGYSRRFPVGDASRLLLATRVGGSSLAAGNGYPVRLVAPGWRGFWWVKWVSEIRPEGLPWWWQPPYPLQ
jgi:DMSO/TMAO reductase YedYZ molybdopterin-dependent catalytic subunit